MSRLLIFSVGLIFPIISLFTSHSRYATSLSERIVPVDVLIIATLTFLVLTGRGLRLSHQGRFYLFSLVLSTIIGILRSHSTTEAPLLATSFIALFVAFLYYVLAYNIARWPVLTQALIIGLCASVLWEAVIVFHDFFSPPAAKWFVDNFEYRVRGTFRTSPQLGDFGFSAAGLLLTVGWAVFDDKRARRLTWVAGLLAATFVIAASSRSGIAALACWAVAYIATAWRYSRQWKQLIGPLCAIVFAGVAFLYGYFSNDPRAMFFLSRMDQFQQGIIDPDKFAQMQLRSVLSHWAEWLPMGLGVGRGYLVDYRGTHEIHNVYLALLVEMGVIGTVAFFWLLVPLVLRSWRRRFGRDTNLVRARLYSFLCGVLVMMMHNRLNRDRTFMLFLGLTSSLALREQPPPQGSGPRGLLAWGRDLIWGSSTASSAEARLPNDDVGTERQCPPSPVP